MELSTDNNATSINHASQALTTVHMTKTLNASVEKIFDAWKTPHLLKEWWGPEMATCPFAVVDFRVGGKYLVEVIKNGTEIFSTGTYEEIFPYRMIVFTDQFNDENGNVIEGQEFSYVTVRFKPIGKEKTNLSLEHKGVLERFQEECEARWFSSLDKLHALVKNQ